MSSTLSHPNRSPMLSPITPSLYGAVPGSIFSALTANPDVNMVNETLTMMKNSLGNLDRVFDSLGQQTEQMAQIGGEFETAQLLNKVRKEMDESDKKLEAGIQEIKALLENALRHEIVEHLRSLIEAGVLEEIDEVVKEKVAEEIPRLMPQHLQNEVAVYRKQLQEVQRALHNSESRRANSLVRTSKLTENLHTIYKMDGTISPLFPKSLHALFSMNGETAQQLLEEYDLWDASKSRERNLNAFMQFCGVNYQLVVTAGGSRPLKVSTPSAIEAINRLV